MWLTLEFSCMQGQPAASLVTLDILEEVYNSFAEVEERR
jgi:hypothetical protein